MEGKPSCGRQRSLQARVSSAFLKSELSEISQFCYWGIFYRPTVIHPPGVLAGTTLSEANLGRMWLSVRAGGTVSPIMEGEPPCGR